MISDELKNLWQQMADMTKPLCRNSRANSSEDCYRKGYCLNPGSCCSPEYCEMAIEIAKENGEELRSTGHPRLPLMGPDGCVAPPHLRPLCTLHVCCINNLGFKPDDEDWTREYFDLREKIDKLDFKEKYGDAHEEQSG